MQDSEKVGLDDEAAEALVRISQGDLRKAITALQVAAALEKNVSRSLIYETSATAPPESLHQYLMACRFKMDSMQHVEDYESCLTSMA